MKLTVSARLSPPQNELFRGKLEGTGVDHNWVEDDEPDVVYLCGLPASYLLDRYAPLAAPLLSGERYQSRSVYFVDVIGRRGETADRRWAFNEKASFSGWLAVQHGLLRHGPFPEDISWVETGSHLDSIEAVRGGRADRGGIDSIILDLVPHLLDGLEVVTTWGPWPAPPVMASRRLGPDVMSQLRSSLSSNEGGEWLLLEEDHLAPIVALSSGGSRPS
ncbi:MAG: phosphate/phosphite/phosphonate ABC transporter substrate-binding protein [Actinobacteria bacterium]|nr:phosphate/phosphite/phosphonate ABC transporter substrate-binding protein [Actinomycetota bacterium]